MGKKIGDEKLVRLLIRNFSSFLFTTKFIFFSLSFALGIFAVANLRKPASEDNISRKGIDVVIALDVSKSMLAIDVQPNRLETAKQMILKLMDQMPDDRIALVLFAGKAYLQMPLTTDHTAAGIFVSAASPDAVPSQGTVFGEALKMSNLTFNTKEGRFKTVILISDGEDHDEEALKTVDELVKEGVMICTVGIGTPEGSQIPDSLTHDFKKDAMGNIVITKLNEEELKTIAEKSSGIYVHFQNNEQTINELMKQLSQVERKKFTDVSLLNYKTYFMWFAVPMFLFLIAEFLIPERKKKNCMNRELLITSLFCLVAILSSAQDTSKLIDAGNNYYRHQQYDKAEAEYRKVLEISPDNQTAKFNLANSLIKQNKNDDAIKLLTELNVPEKKIETRSDAFYNLGVIFSNQKKVEESIEAYKETLRLNPADNDARENLQKALLELKKKNPPEENKSNKKNKEPPQKQQPKTKLSPKQVQQQLKSLEQKEKELQQRLQKNNSKTSNSEPKDW
jgi:Ca-activated chloride channel family protein